MLKSDHTRRFELRLNPSELFRHRMVIVNVTLTLIYLFYMVTWHFRIDICLSSNSWKEFKDKLLGVNFDKFIEFIFSLSSGENQHIDQH